MSKAVFCLSDSEVQAENIVTELKSAGFSNNDISVLFPDKAGTKDFAHEQHTKAPEGAATGAGTGGILGGGLGWLIGIGSLAIPGVGPFIAAGPIMAALAGAGIGAAVDRGVQRPGTPDPGAGRRRRASSRGHRAPCGRPVPRRPAGGGHGPPHAVAHRRLLRRNLAVRSSAVRGGARWRRSPFSLQWARR